MSRFDDDGIDWNHPSLWQAAADRPSTSAASASTSTSTLPIDRPPSSSRATPPSATSTYALAQHRPPSTTTGWMSRGSAVKNATSHTNNAGFMSRPRPVNPAAAAAAPSSASSSSSSTSQPDWLARAYGEPPASGVSGARSPYFNPSSSSTDASSSRPTSHGLPPPVSGNGFRFPGSSSASSSTPASSSSVRFTQANGSQQRTGSFNLNRAPQATQRSAPINLSQYSYQPRGSAPSHPHASNQPAHRGQSWTAPRPIAFPSGFNPNASPTLTHPTRSLPSSFPPPSASASGSSSVSRYRTTFEPAPGPATSNGRGQNKRARGSDLPPLPDYLQQYAHLPRSKLPEFLSADERKWLRAERRRVRVHEKDSARALAAARKSKEIIDLEAMEAVQTREKGGWHSGRIKVSFQLCAADRVAVETQPRGDARVINLIKDIQGSYFDSKLAHSATSGYKGKGETSKGLWTIPLSTYDACRARLMSLRSDSLDVIIVGVDPKHLRSLRGNTSTSAQTKFESMQGIPPALARGLYPFQRAGVEFCVNHDGRAMIGDEMGLGKTVQAIAVAAYYSRDWPLLVVCPSSVRLTWRNELLKWLGFSSLQDSDVMQLSSDEEDDIDDDDEGDDKWNRRRNARPSPSPSPSPSPDQSDDLDGFIVPDDAEDDDDDDDDDEAEYIPPSKSSRTMTSAKKNVNANGSSQIVSVRHRRRRAHSESEDDDDGDDLSQADSDGGEWKPDADADSVDDDDEGDRPARRRRRTKVEDENAENDDEVDEDEYAPVTRRQRGRKRRKIIDDSDEEEDDEMFVEAKSSKEMRSSHAASDVVEDDDEALALAIAASKAEAEAEAVATAATVGDSAAPIPPPPPPHPPARLSVKEQFKARMQSSRTESSATHAKNHASANTQTGGDSHSRSSRPPSSTRLPRTQTELNADEDEELRQSLRLIEEMERTQAEQHVQQPSSTVYVKQEQEVDGDHQLVKQDEEHSGRIDLVSPDPPINVKSEAPDPQAVTIKAEPESTNHDIATDAKQFSTPGTTVKVESTLAPVEPAVKTEPIVPSPPSVAAYVSAADLIKPVFEEPIKTPPTLNVKSEPQPSTTHPKLAPEPAHAHVKTELVQKKEEKSSATVKEESTFRAAPPSISPHPSKLTCNNGLSSPTPTFIPPMKPTVPSPSPPATGPAFRPISKNQIHVILSGKQPLMGPASSQTRVVIISYDLVAKYALALQRQNFQFIICDESHYIKNATAKRSQALLPLLEQAKRVIMLSGTPAMNRPYELYPQINALRPTAFGSAAQFGARYCAPSKGFRGKVEYKGATNTVELHMLLKQYVLIRRLKEEVLTDLRPKTRTAIVTAVHDRAMQEQIKRIAAIKQIVAQELDSTEQTAGAAPMSNGEARKAMMQLYADTGRVKLPFILSYLSDLLDGGTKFLVFAHHLLVLDGIEEFVKKRDVGYFRLDGSTKPADRQAGVEKFQTDPSCRVALLSITAGGTGITLTAASTVVFAELQWTPALLCQAEDRVHRIGQFNPVNCYYVIAMHTLDEILWPMLSRKLEVLGNTLNGREDVLAVAGVHRAGFSARADLALEFKRAPQTLDLTADDDDAADDDDDIEMKEEKNQPASNGMVTSTSSPFAPSPFASSNTLSKSHHSSSASVPRIGMNHGARLSTSVVAATATTTSHTHARPFMSTHSRINASTPPLKQHADSVLSASSPSPAAPEASSASSSLTSALVHEYSPSSERRVRERAMREEQTAIAKRFAVPQTHTNHEEDQTSPQLTRVNAAEEDSWTRRMRAMEEAADRVANQAAASRPPQDATIALESDDDADYASDDSDEEYEESATNSARMQLQRARERRTLGQS